MFPIRDHNPSERVPFVTYALILANVAVFLLTLPAQGSEAALIRLYNDYALIPAEVTRGQDLGTILTSMFMHGGFLHLAGNMLFLWIFGDNLEEQFGHLGFTLFYLAGGAAAAAAQIAADPFSRVPMVGASGAIAAVMGGYLVLFPRAKVDVLIIFVVFFRIIPLPAWIMLGVWFAIQLVSGAANSGAQGGVAYWAHAGGFIAGVVLVLPLWLRRGGTAFWQRTHGHPPNPEAKYLERRSTIPRVRRR